MDGSGWALSGGPGALDYQQPKRRGAHGRVARSRAQPNNSTYRARPVPSYGRPYTAAPLRPDAPQGGGGRVAAENFGGRVRAAYICAGLAGAPR
jgi:hypothetical protein